MLVFSMLVPAPLEGIANLDLSPNPAKAPWYFMGLQELLLHFHSLALTALGLFLLDEWITRFLNAATEERILFFAVFLFIAFLVLTLIGIFFRGPGMALYWPWHMPTH